MPNVQHNTKLNELLISISRSLLQYVGHSCSWTSRADASLADEFSSIVATQQEHVADLSELLVERRWTIDFGGFPAEYTDLHFLSLKYLLKKIVENQHHIVAELDEASHTSVDDPEAASLIDEILASERELTDRLNSLSRPKAAT